MQFNSPRQKVTTAVAVSKSRKTLGYVENNRTASGKINISMYTTPPLEDITLTEFDEIAQERLNILRFIEDTKERHTFGSEEYSKALENKMRMAFPIANIAPGLSSSELNTWKRKDSIGHFILRLAFCTNPEQTKWFINQEVDFFRFRLKQLDQWPNLQAEFLKMNNLNIQVVSKEEQYELQPLLDVSFGTIEAASTMQCYFKLPFTDAFDLIRRRKVLLRRGMAYIHNESLASALCGTLRAQMMATMTRAFKQLAMLEEENRIFPRLARLANNAYTGKTYAGNEKGDKISRHQLDQLCGASFPPCMKQIHQRFRSEHHLRHGARRQYGLFLKGIGLSLEEALAFMREEFTKKIDSDKFDKQYAYNVRHMYGKEGKRVGYPALPCSTIILSNPPAAGDCHGCPFKHTDHALLAQRLAKDNLAKEQVNQVIEFAKVSAYDKACTRFFEFSHKMESGALGQLIVHPNQFFELSKEVLSGTRAKDKHIHMSQAQQTRQKSDFNPFPVALGPIDGVDDDF